MNAAQSDRNKKALRVIVSFEPFRPMRSVIRVSEIPGKFEKNSFRIQDGAEMDINERSFRTLHR
jgi:hypothetical protein